MEISLAAEKLFTIAGLSITNTVFTALIIFVIIAILALLIRRGISLDYPSKFVVMIEMLVEGLYGMAEDAIGSKHIKSLFGFVFTFFLLIFVSNWFGLLPIVPALSVEKEEAHEEVSAEEHNTEEVAVEDTETDHQAESALDADNHDSEQEATVVDTEEHEEEQKGGIWECIKTQHCYITTSGIREFHSSVHILRAPTSDLSLTVALAIISVLVTNVLGFAIARKAYLRKYINFKSGVDAFVGLLEIVSEFGKIISFSFRLFGNVFAGEILLAVITSISFGLATLPFLFLEIFVGAIQAFVFFMLTSIFIGLAINHHDH